MQIHKRAIIATHVLHYGASHALRDYLMQKKYEILFIGLPFFTQRNTIIEEYSHGEILKTTMQKRKIKSDMVNYAIDFYQVIKINLLHKRKYDIFVGVDNLTCLAGLILKKINKVKKVIYYSIDFVPIRFENRLINSLYHTIEIFCVKHSDEVWNVSPRIGEGREEFFNVPQKLYKQKVVPIGVWQDKKMIYTKNTRKRPQAVFIGHILEKQGVQVIIEAIPTIIRSIPDFSFVIIGDGEYLGTLKRLVKKYKVQKYVTFMGTITDKEEIQQLLHNSSCAVATYKPEKEKLRNFTYYADPTKIKDYLNAGLPIILTDVPYNAFEIEDRECGLVVQYDKDQVADAIVLLLKNPKRLEKFHANSISYAKEFDWNHIFRRTSL